MQKYTCFVSKEPLFQNVRYFELTVISKEPLFQIDRWSQIGYKKKLTKNFQLCFGLRTDIKKAKAHNVSKGAKNLQSLTIQRHKQLVTHPTIFTNFKQFKHFYINKIHSQIFFVNFYYCE